LRAIARAARPAIVACHPLGASIAFGRRTDQFAQLSELHIQPPTFLVQLIALGLPRGTLQAQRVGLILQVGFERRSFAQHLLQFPLNVGYAARLGQQHRLDFNLARGEVRPQFGELHRPPGCFSCLSNKYVSR
jgi:hypothetical protein